ncbi:hypothetical protein D3C86_1830140 [compost metagenome]
MFVSGQCQGINQMESICLSHVTFHLHKPFRKVLGIMPVQEKYFPDVSGVVTVHHVGIQHDLAWGVKHVLVYVVRIRDDDMGLAYFIELMQCFWRTVKHKACSAQVPIIEYLTHLL